MALALDAEPEHTASSSTSDHSEETTPMLQAELKSKHHGGGGGTGPRAYRKSYREQEGAVGSPVRRAVGPCEAYGLVL